MEKEKFYSNRYLTGLLSILQFGAAYLIYTKLLADPYGITDIALIFLYVLFVVAIIFSAACLVLTLDPRPIIQISSEGIYVRRFIFLEEFVPWSEVLGAKQETYTKRMLNTETYAKVTTRLLRIYRSGKRSFAVNLTLLNKRGDTFHRVISKYITVDN